MKNFNVFAALLLLLGVLFLLHNFGFISGDIWDIFWKAFWPLLIVGIAVNMFIKTPQEGESKKNPRRGHHK